MGATAVISRHWRGTTKQGQDQAYIDHLKADTFPKLRAIPGFVSASILKRDGVGGSEFEIVTVWQSRTAIEAFAGQDIDAAVVPEAAQAMLAEFDRRVRHFEIVDTVTRTGSHIESGNGDSMELETRILDSSNQALLAGVAPDVFDNAIDPRLASEFLSDPRHHLAVAIDRGQVIGFASGVHYVHPDKPAELWINEVGVAPDHQRRGVGKAVVRALLEHGKSLGCEQAWVLTDNNNTAAMRLYTSAGGKAEPDPSVMFTFTLGREHDDE